MKANQDASETPSRINSKTRTARHIKIKLFKAKQLRILKAGKQKKFFTYKRASIRLTANFSTETMEARN